MSIRLRSILTAVLAITLLPLLAVPAGATTIGGSAPVGYTEQDPAVGLLPGLSLTGGTAYDGQYIDIVITGATTDETLGLVQSGSTDVTNGAVSVVGTSVFLGNGTTADPIGSVDSIRNGTNGNPLRINFTSDFANPSFETGSSVGWTAMDQFIDLGVTSIAGFVSADTSDYGSNPGSGGNDDDVPSSSFPGRRFTPGCRRAHQRHFL